jgi:hypothetical protein
MRVTESAGADNLRLESLRRLVDQLRQKGLDRNAIFYELIQARQRNGWHISDDDFTRLLNSLPTKSQDVNQEYQESQNRQGKPRSARECQRITPGRSAEEVFLTELEAGVPSSLSFPTYFCEAVKDYYRGDDSAERDEWKSPLFHLVRLVKAHPDMATSDAGDALRRIADILLAWSKQKPPDRSDPWEKWLRFPQEEVETEFCGGWDKVRYLPGRGPLGNALERAHRQPLQLRPEIARRRPCGYPGFIAIAGWLQVCAGDSNILLPVEELAPLLKVKPMTISRYRKWGIEDGYLKEVKSYEFRGEKKAGKATEFRFNMPKFPCLADTAQQGTAERFEEA